MINLRFLLIVLILTGFGIFSYSLTLEYYTDNKHKAELDGMIDSPKFESHNDFKKFYYAEIAKIETPKRHLMDLGSGIAILGLTLLIMSLISQVKTWSDLTNVKSISKGKIYGLANASWLFLIPGTCWYYSFRMIRGDYPSFADSLAIPLMSQIPLIIILVIPMNFFLWLTSNKTYLDSKLLIRANYFTGRAIVIEIFWGFFLLQNMFILYSFVTDGDHVSIPVNVIFTLILLSLRAGQIEKFNKRLDSVETGLIK